MKQRQALFPPRHRFHHKPRFAPFRPLLPLLGRDTRELQRVDSTPDVPVGTVDDDIKNIFRRLSSLGTTKVACQKRL